MSANELHFFGVLLAVLVMVGRADAQTALESGPWAPFLEQNCSDCHSGPDPDGGLDLHALSADFRDSQVRRQWAYLHDRVAGGQMPPKSVDRPEAQSTEAFLDAVSDTLTRADRANRRVVLRRLNRNEYAHTVGDLFGIHVDVSRILLDDATESGFDNIGNKLSVSAEQMTLYLEAADEVLDRVFGPAKRPRSMHQTVNFATTGRGIGESERKLPDGVVLFSGAMERGRTSIRWFSSAGCEGLSIRLVAAAGPTHSRRPTGTTRSINEVRPLIVSRSINEVRPLIVSVPLSSPFSSPRIRAGLLSHHCADRVGGAFRLRSRPALG